MTGLLKLAKRLEKTVGALDKKSSALSTDVAMLVITDLVNVTPVDESTALSNWQIGIGSPVQSPIGAYVVGKGGSTQSVSAAEALDAARAALATKKPGQPIYISNLLPYIRVLNDGSSTQEPRGFIQRAASIGRRFTSGIKILRTLE